MANVRINMSTEIPKETAGRLKEFLRDYYIPFEPSECGNLIHFEISLKPDEVDMVNLFIETRC